MIKPETMIIIITEKPHNYIQSTCLPKQYKSSRHKSKRFLPETSYIINFL
jgi:hypothetical protein